ncbi:hypothetical protein B0T26DRAFT_447410 [Lasiosphaeria miniovina]|uniref:Uncharacterized protein n=1 Tax=Lasiosphaeria miniovina TaxID=1954250 RepID=A0AA40DM54_9PEZI|nr:uncharacterized protein B0T26DRAFT_447410 [Lasiosphaeria miniovina]KAK0706326.1 hypothetical protein B0T26DRAFT_447410 [Lasiosphaeria miniovina]
MAAFWICPRPSTRGSAAPLPPSKPSMVVPINQDLSPSCLRAIPVTGLHCDGHCDRLSPTQPKDPYPPSYGLGAKSPPSANPCSAVPNQSATLQPKHAIPYQACFPHRAALANVADWPRGDTSRSRPSQGYERLRTEYRGSGFRTDATSQ